MSYDYKALKKNTGKDNSPGIKKKVYVAPRSWFDDANVSGGLQVPIDVPVNPGDEYTISTDHNFITGEGFIEMYTTLDTGEFTAELVGDRDSRTTNPKLTVMHPGMDAERIEFAENVKNDEFIVLFEGLDGTIYQMGQDGLECDIVPSRASGKVSGGYFGQTFNIESFGPIFVYTGALTLKPVA
jgi:hypothetical protein